MKIRTKILLSYIFILAVLVCGIYLVFDLFTIRQLTGDHIRLAKKGVNGISRANLKMSKYYLQQHGEQIVKLIARQAAAKLENYLTKMSPDELKDYVKLRKDTKLRELVDDGIYVYGKYAGYIDVYDRNGVAVIHPNQDVEGRNFSEWRKKYPEMWKLVQKSFEKQCIDGYYKFADPVTQKTRRKYMSVCQVPGTDFNVVAAVNISDYFDSVHDKIKSSEQKHIDFVNDKIQKSSVEISSKIKAMSIPFVIGLALVCGVFAIWFSDTLTKPIVSLKEGVKDIGKGEFSVKVKEKGTQETVELAQVFNQLGSQLSEYMDNLKRETAAREAVESEIRIARDIQQSLLQKTFPPFPGHDEFELFALLEPAKEVAGDFYDYFFIDKKHMVIMVGDVSGKGVPAAFFMAITRTMLKNICQLEHDPGKVLKRVNDMLCEENDACMFVTVLLGIYNIETGELRYANGGHNEMLKLGSNGEFDKFGMLSNVALGVMPDAKFTTARYQLEPDDILALYTDGLIEAVGAGEELYGEERFRKAFKENSDLSVNFLAAAVIEDVTTFEQGQRFDDITLMVLKRI